MREYGQIQCSYWEHASEEGWSTDAMLLGAYLMTGPHSNGIGTYRLPDGYIQDDLGWTSERVSKGFAELSQKGFCNRFGKVVHIPKFLRWNPISNSNVAKARQKEFESLPSDEAKQSAAPAMLEFGDHWAKGFETLLQTLSKRYAEQEPTQTNPEPEPTREKTLLSSSPGERDGSGDVRTVFEFWKQAMGHPRAKLDSKRQTKIKARLKDGYTVEDLCKAVDGCRRSPHHMGENDQGAVYDDIELICRDATKVDRFMALADSPNLTGVSAATRKTAHAAREFVGGSA